MEQGRGETIGEVLQKGQEQIKENVSEKERKKFRVSLLIKLVAATVFPVVLICIVLAVISMNAMSNGLGEKTLDNLQALSCSVRAAYDQIAEGDFWVGTDGQLMKGNQDISSDPSVIDSFTEENDADITIFYGNIRYATSLINPDTGERIVGTEADPAIYHKVVELGENYETSHAMINGSEYYACYVPLYNSDGTIIGMMFAGEPAADVKNYIRSHSVVIFVVAIILAVGALLAIAVIMLGLKKGITQALHAVMGLSTGDLKVHLPKKGLKRSDELGDMIRGVQGLCNQLSNVVKQIHTSSGQVANAGEELSETAGQTSSTADEISRAVEDISKGAVAQAEEIDSASESIENMGNMIEKIVRGVESLDEASRMMKQAGDESSVIIGELASSSDHTLQAIQKINEQVMATNDSAVKISEAIELITAIAEETNLLSLNASIEAARAGEQGRGFAVVANQIQKLAEQSNESAQRIAEIIQELLADSENTVSVMGEVRHTVDSQQQKLQETRNQFRVVQDGIMRSREETEEIKSLTENCDQARIRVMDIIANLSAISEENAAATEETTASMQELNATINLLAESAKDMDTLAADLRKEISFFQL